MEQTGGVKIVPIIRNLRGYIERGNISFKVLERDSYMKGHYTLSKEVSFLLTRSGEVEVIIHYNSDHGSESETFKTLDDAIRYIEERFPSSAYVYYYSSLLRPPDRNFVNIRSLFGFTIDEAEAWKTILARAWGHLNGRIMIGFRVLKRTRKKCSICRKETAKILAVFEYRRKRYGVYYCSECWKVKVAKAILKIKDVVDEIRFRLAEIAEINYKEIIDVEEKIKKMKGHLWVP